MIYAVLKLFILILAIFFILAIIYRAYLLKKTNQELENRVAFEIKQNEEKNGILLQQSKMAAMGEMLENIAHQWRQPLSTIGICTSGMELKKNLNMLEDKDFYDSINHIKSSISYLSNTIEDFRSFLNKDKVLSNVNINHLVQKVLDILNPSLQSHHIEVIKNIDDFEFVTIENDLIQILMNIITNAKDALKDLKDEEPRYIFINISKNQKNIVIEIFDNAMGIKDEIISRIFEPYFTTKHKSQGTGIGLYMSKILVDNNLKGTIFVENYKFLYNNIDYKGAKFNILLPINLDNK
jgi:signal transduction histidine kinase